MHIAVDARELTGRPTGVGTYLAHLLAEWAHLPEAAAHRWSLYVPSSALVPGTKSGANVGGTATWRQAPFAVRQVPGTGGTMWEQGALGAALRRDRPDVLFAPGYTAPLAVRLPIVLTVHDVSYFAHPEWFGSREGFRRRLVTRRAARRARVVLTVSEFSRQQILRRLGIRAERVQVIRHGIARPAAAPPGSARTPTILYVGSILNRRRVPDLIRAFRAVLADVRDARLELVGENRTHPHEDLERLVRELGLEQVVELRSYISDADLEAAYCRARVFAFLSEYEGFGLTPLEAMAHNVPPVVLDTPIAREVYEDAALYVASGDVAGTAAALTRLLGEDEIRDRLLEASSRLLPRYSWPEAARATLAAIERGASC